MFQAKGNEVAVSTDEQPKHNNKTKSPKKADRKRSIASMFNWRSSKKDKSKVGKLKTTEAHLNPDTSSKKPPVPVKLFSRSNETMKLDQTLNNATNTNVNADFTLNNTLICNATIADINVSKSRNFVRRSRSLQKIRDKIKLKRRSSTRVNPTYETNTSKPILKTITTEHHTENLVPLKSSLVKRDNSKVSDSMKCEGLNNLERYQDEIESGADTHGLTFTKNELWPDTSAPFAKNLSTHNLTELDFNCMNTTNIIWV